MGSLCCVIGQTISIYSRSASLLYTEEYSLTSWGRGGGEALPAMAHDPIKGKVAILLVASCYGNWDKL